MLNSIQRTFDNPFQALRQLDSIVGHAFDQATASSVAGSFPVDIREQGDQLHVVADLPGFTKDQIDVSVEQGVLTIEAQRTDDRESAEGKTHLKERQFSQVSRRFRLPKVYDTQQVDATLVDGVLTLTLPKTEESKPRKIQVK